MSLIIIVLIFLFSFYIYYINVAYNKSSLFLFGISIILTFSLLYLIKNEKKSFICFFIIIILTYILFYYVQLFEYPFLIGVDPWFHWNFNNDIIESNIIPYSTAQYFGDIASSDVQYGRMPLFHCIIAIVRICGNLDYKTATFFSFTLISGILIFLLTFFFGKNIFHDTRIAFFSGFVAVFSEHVIFMLTSPIPFAYGGLILILALYILIFKLNENKHIFYFLLVFLLILPVFINFLSAIAVISILTIILITSIILYYNKINTNIKPKTVISIYFLTLLCSFSWWAYISGHLIKFIKFLPTLFDAEYLIRGYSTIGKYISPQTMVISNFPVLLLHFFGILGVTLFLYHSYIEKKFNYRNYFFILILLFFIVIGIIPRFFGITFLESRWWYISEILISVFMAFLFINIISREKLNHYLKIIIVIVIFTYFYMSLTEPQYVCIDDNSYFNKNNFRYTITLSEFKLKQFTDSIDYNTIYTDEYFSYIFRVFSINSQDLNYNFFNMKYLDNNYFKNNDMFIIRDYIIHYPFKIYQYVIDIGYNPRILLEKQYGFNQIYSSNGGGIFIPFSTK